MRDRLTPAEIKRMDRFVMRAGVAVVVMAYGGIALYLLVQVVRGWRG